MNRSLNRSSTSSLVSLRATSIARHSRVCSSTIVSIRNGTAVGRSIRDEVVAPDVIPMSRPKPHARTVIQARAAGAWAASAALLVLPGARSARLACDSPANPPDATAPSPGGSRTGRTRVASSTIRFISRGSSLGTCRQRRCVRPRLAQALDTPGVRSRSRVREHLGHARPLAAASPGSEVSRGGLPQDRLIQLRVGQQPLQPSVLFLQFLQPLRLVDPQPTVLLFASGSTSAP